MESCKAGERNPALSKSLSHFRTLHLLYCFHSLSNNIKNTLFLLFMHISVLYNVSYCLLLYSLFYDVCIYEYIYTIFISDEFKSKLETRCLFTPKCLSVHFLKKRIFSYHSTLLSRQWLSLPCPIQDPTHRLHFVVLYPWCPYIWSNSSALSFPTFMFLTRRRQLFCWLSLHWGLPDGTT